jgi:hypothetical protein
MAKWQEELADLLGMVSDPKDREQLEKLYDKYQPVREYGLRQADFSRKSAEVEKQRGENGEYKTRLDKWWEDNKQFPTKAAELETQLAAALAKAATGGDVDQAVLEKIVETKAQELLSKQGFISRTDMDAIVAKEKEVLEKQLIPASMNFAYKMATFAMEHKGEFGEKFDDKAFTKFAAESGIADPDKAYDTWVSGKRTDKKVEDARKAGLEEGRKAAEDKFAQTAHLPGSDAMPSAGEGAVQIFRRTAQTEHDKAIENARPGDGTLAAMAGKELRSEGRY